MLIYLLSLHNVCNYSFPKLIFQASKSNDGRTTISARARVHAHADASNGRANYFKSISSINMYSISNQASAYGMLNPLKLHHFFMFQFALWMKNRKCNVNNTNHNECFLFKRWSLRSLKMDFISFIFHAPKDSSSICVASCNESTKKEIKTKKEKKKKKGTSRKENVADPS